MKRLPRRPKRPKQQILCILDARSWPEQSARRRRLQRLSGLNLKYRLLDFLLFFAHDT